MRVALYPQHLNEVMDENDHEEGPGPREEGTSVLWVSMDVPPKGPCFLKFCTHKNGVLQPLKAPIRVGFSRFLHPY